MGQIKHYFWVCAWGRFQVRETLKRHTRKSQLHSPIHNQTGISSLLFLELQFPEGADHGLLSAPWLQYELISTHSRLPCSYWCSFSSTKWYDVNICSIPGMISCLTSSQAFLSLLVLAICLFPAPFSPTAHTCLPWGPWRPWMTRGHHRKKPDIRSCVQQKPSPSTPTLSHTTLSTQQ